MSDTVQSAKNRKRVAKLLVGLALKSNYIDLGVNLQGHTSPEGAVASCLKRPSYVREIYTSMQRMAAIGGAVECYPEIPEIIGDLKDLLPVETMRVIKEYWATNPAQTKDERSFANLSKIFLSSVIEDIHAIRFYANLDSRVLYYNLDDKGTFARIRCKDDRELQNELQNNPIKYMCAGLLNLAKAELCLQE